MSHLRPSSLASLCILAFAACTSRDPAVRDAADPNAAVTTVHGALGCLFEMTIRGVEEGDARHALDLASAEIDAVEDALGGWRDDTALAALNRDGAKGPVAVPPLLFDSITRSIELTAATHGAFDVTVGPLVDAYGFRRGAPKLPNPADLERLRKSVGIEHLVLDRTHRTIAFDRGGVEIDLDGINKGIAVDRVMELLRGLGVIDATISAGGSTIGSIGPADSEPPREIAIEGPDGEIHARASLRNEVLSTSGNWRHNIVVDGHEYGSIFDPRDGRPVEGDIVSATAIAPRGDESEAFAKVGVVLGPEGAESLTRQRPDVRMVLLVREAPGSSLLIVDRFGER